MKEVLYNYIECFHATKFSQILPGIREIKFVKYGNVIAILQFLVKCMDSLNFKCKQSIFDKSVNNTSIKPIYGIKFIKDSKFVGK